MKELDALREKIDAIDDQLLALLDDRARLALQISEQKQRVAEDPLYYQPEREAVIFERLLKNYSGPLSQASIQHIFSEILSACRALQHQHHVAYLGPVGTFSYEAAKQQFGLSEILLPKPTFEAVFSSVIHGEADYAVVPIENSTTGLISETNEWLQKTKLQVCAEFRLPVRFCLVSQCETINQIKKLFVHPQAEMQCQHWLAEYLPNVKKITVNSNGEAAKLASETASSGALASSEAGKQFGLIVLEHDVQDQQDNETRFLVLKKS